MTTQTTVSTETSSHVSHGRSNRLLRAVPALAGVAYTLVWVVGLLIWPSNLDVTASGSAVLATFVGHRSVALVQYLLVEGAAAIALAGVVLALGRAASRAAAREAGRVAVVAGLTAAALSLTQCLLGVILIGSAVSGGDASRAGTIFDLISRMDGAKMFALAVLAVAGVALARRKVLPRWLGIVGGVLALALMVSGIGYLLLISPLALAAAASLLLLLLWVTGVGVTLTWMRR